MNIKKIIKFKQMGHVLKLFKQNIMNYVTLNPIIIKFVFMIYLKEKLFLQ